MSIVRNGFPRPTREYRFATAVDRQYRFDFAWPHVHLEALGGLQLAFEIEGGGPTGHHQSYTGYTYDCRKYNLALSLGWAVFRFTPEMLDAKEHMRVLREVWPHDRAGRPLHFDK